MLKGLFKSAWKNKSAEKRLGFISDIDVTTVANQSILENLAVNDVDILVRNAALAKISDPQALFNIWQSKSTSDADSESSQSAESAFCNLIQSGSHFSASDYKAFTTKNPKSLLTIAKYCPDETIRNEVLLSLNESEKADIISEIPYSITRVMMAEKIHGISSLEVARKNLKGKDKNAERIIKAKIDSFHALQKLELENTILVSSIREKMEGLARYVNWSDEIRVKFHALSKSWTSLDFDPSLAEQALYKVAFTKVEADVNHNASMTSSLKNQEKIVNRLESMCTNIAAFSLDELLKDSTDISNELNDLGQQLNKESKTIPHSTNIDERFKRVKKAIQSAIAISESIKELRAISNVETITNISNQQVSNDGSGNVSNGVSNDDNSEVKKIDVEAFVESKPTVNESKQKAKSVLLTTSRAVEKSAWLKNVVALTFVNEAILEANNVLNLDKDARKEAKDTLDNLHKKINRIFGAAKRGDISRAQRDLTSAVKAASKYQGNDRKKLDERIEEVTADVSKMGDWKDFAIEPKLIELCEQMEQLPELERKSKNPSADNLAKKIKALQKTWKTLGSSDISDTYWPRFKEAGDKAYEPCAEFFKQRREIQRDNLQKREPLLSKMKELFETTDWDNKPNFKSIEDSVSHIMQSWKKIKDVEHGRGQKQWEKLAAIKDQINERLDVEYDKNIAEKQALTTQFEQMLEQEVTVQSIDKLQFIQSKWKQVGVTRRKQDQIAWLKFKAASDAVYEKIQGLRQEKRAVEDEKIEAYKQIHTQIHQLAKSTQDLIVSDKEFEALEQQYNALPALPTGLPEKLIERLNKDYIRACDAYGNAHERLNKAKNDSELQTLIEKAKLCSSLEKLTKGSEKEITELENKINKLELTNKDYAKRFAKRFKKAKEQDREDFGKARRLLLIDCEILLGVDSPKEDKDLRLQIQLDRMKEQGLGNAESNVSVTIEKLELEWLFIPGAEAKLQKMFDLRFDELMKQKR